MKRRIVSIVIAAMTLILCAVPATAEPGSSETLYSDGLVTSESAVYSLVGSDRIAVNVPAKMTAAEMKSQIVSSRGVDVIAPDGESVLADDSFVPVEMTYENYKACSAPKRLFIVPGADHAGSCYVNPHGYERALISFWHDFDN